MMDKWLIALGVGVAAAVVLGIIWHLARPK